MPFANLGDDPQQEYFADGMVEELITALAHVPRLFVVGRGSTSAYKGTTVEPRRVAEELGVRYVLQGSVRKAADRVRIGGQLIDADTGATLWAERFDGALADVFALQDRMSEAVVGAIAPRLEAAEIERARRKPPENLDAWDLCLRAWPLILTMARADQDAALGHLRQAIALDPRYALALGMAAWCYSLRLPNLWGTPAQNVREGLPLARRAIACGQDDAEALAMGGYALAYLGREYAAGLTALDRALALNTNSARGNTFAGWVRAYVGEHAAAVEHFQRALRLSPLDPMAFRTRVGLAFALLFLGRLEPAAESAAQAVRQQPGFSPAHRALAAALAHLGRLDEARAAVRQLEQVVPGISIEYAMAETRFTRPEDRERMETGLRLAGLGQSPTAPAAPAAPPSVLADGGGGVAEPSPAPPQHIVVVDDEAGLRRTLQDFLTKRGFAVTTAEGGTALRRIMAQRPADLVLLDINMPGEDGLSLARYLRQETRAAIIMLTAASDVVDRVLGLELGADDYIAKPFDLREVLARVRSVLRRAAPPPG
jgi:TolB-like protein/Tfp pilus assembly protein PilF